MSRCVALMLLVLLPSVLCPARAAATELKVSNDSSLVLRLQIADLDDEPPRSFKPGFWGMVEPEVPTGRGWSPRSAARSAARVGLIRVLGS